MKALKNASAAGRPASRGAVPVIGMPAKLTDDLSWPLERAEAWLTESLTSALLAPKAAGLSSPAGA